MTSAEQLEILAMAHALIEAGWVKRAARLGDRYCLVGAIHEAARQSGPCTGLQETVALLEATLHDCLGNASPTERLAFWNDAPQRCQQDILCLIEAAAAKVGKG